MDTVRWLLEKGIPYIIVVFLGVLVLTLICNDDIFMNKTSLNKSDSTIVVGSFDGYILCQVCHLKQGVSTQHDCNISGHQHVFKITKIIDTSGNNHAELHGTTLSYQNNPSELKLIAKFHGAYSRMKGKIYLDRKMVTVKSIRKITTSGKRFKSLREPWLISELAPVPRSVIAFT